MYVKTYKLIFIPSMHTIYNEIQTCFKGLDDEKGSKDGHLEMNLLNLNGWMTFLSLLKAPLVAIAGT